MTDQQLIELSTNNLLDKFGSGSHKPGSGSAAALMGILGCKLILTVCALSLDKPKYKNDYSKINLIKKEISDVIEPRLKELFERDSIVFDEVIKLRNIRDQALTDQQKRRDGDKAQDKLKEATEIPIEICRLSMKLIDYGIVMFDIGFQSARGDAGTAVSAAVAAAMSSIFVINLNLRSFRSGSWALRTRSIVDKLQSSLEDKQLQAFGRVTILKPEELETMSFEF